MGTFRAPSVAGSLATAPNNIVIPRPAMADGDVLYIAVRSQDGSSANDWTPPAGQGFQRATLAPSSLPNSNVRVGGIWMKRITNAANEPSSYTFTGPTGRNVGIAVAETPDRVGDLTVVGATQYGGSSATNGIMTVNAHTLSAAPALSLVAVAGECTAGISGTPSTAPAGFTLIASAQNTLDNSTSGSRTAIALYVRNEPDTSVEALSAGYAGASAVAAYMTSITGGSSAQPVPIGIPVKRSDGSTVYVSYLDAQGVRRAPASIRVQRPQFSTAQSLALPGITMGHRGASQTPGMPEMSRRGYRYAVSTRSYPMLEFSCGRTSDGVFFGLHDQTLARTSENSALTTAVSGMTWAQVQAYLNSLNSGGTPVPYYRLEDFLDEFGQEAALHVDPKYAIGVGGNVPFLNVLKAHGGPEKITVKFVGTGSGATGLATAARNEGFKTAGYFYATDWSAGLIDAEQQFWDIIGMEHDASTDVWSRGTSGAYPGIRSYGKPVLAHILQSQAEYNAVKTKIEEGGWVNPGAGRSWIAQIRRPDLIAPVR